MSDEIMFLLRSFVTVDLSNVAVCVLLTFHSLQILFFDENINAFLDYLNLRLEATGQLIENFGNQLRVV